MTYQIRDLSETRKECTIDYPKAEMATQFQKKLHSLKSRSKIDGFRKGHAPLAMIEQQHSETILQELLDERIQSCWEQIYKSTEVLERPNISVSPKIRRVQDLTSDITITLSFDVPPQLELIDLKDLVSTLNLKFDTPNPITQEKQTSFRKVLSLECSQSEEVQRPAARGDKITLCLTYKNSGEKEDDLVLILDPDHTQEDFISKVEGMTIGEERSLEYNPSRYKEKDKSADPENVEIIAQLKSVHALTLPSTQELCDYIQDLNDVPAEEQESKLKEWIDISIQRVSVQDLYRQNESRLKRAFINHYTFDIPSVHTRDQNFKSSEHKQNVEEAVRLNYVLGAYSDILETKASEAEVDMFAKIFAQDLAVPLPLLAQLLQFNKSLQKSFQDSLSEKIVIKRLLEACGIEFVLQDQKDFSKHNPLLLENMPTDHSELAHKSENTHNHTHCASHCTHEHH